MRSRKYFMRKLFEKIFIYLAHFAYLYWILVVLTSCGQWAMKDVVFHFTFLSLAGGLLIYVSKVVQLRK